MAAPNDQNNIHVPDPVEMSRSMAKIAEQSQRLVRGFLDRQRKQGVLGMDDSLHIGQAFMEMTQAMMTQPAKMVEAQLSLWQGYVDLWQRSAATFFGQQVEPSSAGKGDKRFRDEAWDQNVVFNFIKQSYLLTATWVQDVVSDVEGLDPKSKRKVEFYTRQFVDALAPTNFPITNPEVLRTTVESGGENLVKGLSNLLDDLERGKGKLSIRMTDMDAFELGKNIATTPGKVVFQTALMQLIQYTPSTDKVAKRPLLVVPPWINKYYILDLRAKNSFIKWAVDQGHTVFVISWVNPDEKLAEKTFDDYLTEGTLAALDAIREQTGERQANVVGYCLGGTLLAATLAHLAAKRSNRIASATFFTSLIDFSEPGELEVFIDEEQIEALEKKMENRGYLDGSEMATTFNLLRANDLIWSFFINNYLLGKDPFPFDLLYWNSDSTRMPAKMHSFYLRNMYQRNLLKDPGGLTLAGTKIDLSKVKTPAYFISTVEDHIAPWKATYKGTHLFSGPVKFVLGGSGHIAGVVNPPEANKYCYWTNPELPADAHDWFEAAEQSTGSWWTDWQAWVGEFADGQVDARDPAKGKLTVIEDAPGSYVKERLVK